jgi:hypothetical protein
LGFAKFKEVTEVMNTKNCAYLALILGLITSCGLCLGEILINEVELSPTNGGSMWVELYNTGDQPVDISNWRVFINSTPWVGLIDISNGTLIPQKGFYVAEGDTRWMTINNASSLLVDSQGNKIDKTPILTDMENNDFTEGRIEDGRNTNTRGDWSWMRSSKGRSNR